MSEVAAAECIEYLLNEDRIRQEGLFRVPGNAKKVKHYLEAVDQGTVSCHKTVSVMVFYAIVCGAVASFGRPS